MLVSGCVRRPLVRAAALPAATQEAALGFPRKLNGLPQEEEREGGRFVGLVGGASRWVREGYC